MNAIILFWCLLVTFIVVGLIVALGLSVRKPKTSSQPIEGTGFIPSQVFMGKDNRGGLAINDPTHQICLFETPTAPPRVLPITDLIGCYLINNGATRGQKKRQYPEKIRTFLDEIREPTNDLIKTLHRPSSEGQNQRIDLFLVFHDQDNPLHVVNFLDLDTKEGGILYEKAINAAKHWQSILEGIIHQADQLAQVQAEDNQEQKMAETLP